MLTQNKLHSALFRAVSKILWHVARVFLRNGLSYGQFAEIARQVFVEVAFQEFQPNRRKQSDAHVAVVTGLTRKEVGRLRKMAPDENAASSEKYNRATRVISGWVNDSRFRDANGKPAVLPLSGSGQSFDELVHAYSGDMKTISMLEALENAGTVRRDGDNIHLVKRAYVPEGDSIEKINILGNDCRELLATIDHNLVAQGDQLRFQRKASNLHIAANQSDQIHLMLKEKGQALLEEVDAKMSEIETGFKNSDVTKTVSVGIYFYESVNPSGSA